MPKQRSKQYQVISVFLSCNRVVEIPGGFFPPEELEARREEILNHLLEEARMGGCKNGLLLDIKFVRTLNMPYDERVEEIRALFFKNERYQSFCKDYQPEPL